MSSSSILKFDPRLDLKLERVVDVPKELVWAAWTKPEQIVKWFTPDPWKTIDCEIDLRPGGLFRTIMESPEGEKFPNLGCYLDVVENQRLIWTDTMLPGFRPAISKPSEHGPNGFTAAVILETAGKGTKYTAHAMHRDEADRDKHEKMGFAKGWGAALDQLVLVAKKLRG